MTLLNEFLLGGLILAGLPVLLHMLMRARPKLVEFPALRLLQRRTQSNARRMRIRHVLLMALRILLLILFVLALARPSLPAAAYGLRWYEWTLAVLAVVGTLGFYWHRTRGRPLETAKDREARGRLKLWSVLGGVTAVLMLAGIPYGLRVRGELTNPRGPVSAQVPVSAVLIFDNSVSMEYRQNNKTRVEASASMAAELLDRFPVGSRVAIADCSPESEVVFQSDTSGASSRLERLEMTTTPRPLNRVVRDAIEVQLQHQEDTRREAGLGTAGDVYSREIYLFTDLARSAWSGIEDDPIRNLLEEHQDLRVYLVNSGAAEPVNQQLTLPRLSDATGIVGRPVSVSVTVETTPAAGPQATLEAYLTDADGTERRIGAPQLAEAGTNRAEVSFSVIPTTAGLTQGSIRMVADDPLTADNIRYFTIGVAARPRILLISDQPEETAYLANAIQPEAGRKIGVGLADCRRITTRQAAQTPFTDYDLIFVVNVRRPPSALWQDLRRFAEAGGGVFCCLGHRSIAADAWRTNDAEQLLPGLPVVPLRFPADPTSLVIANAEAPVCRAFSAWDDAETELRRAAFSQRWTLDISSEAAVLMQYSDESRSPALLRRRVGRGSVLLFTSAMDNLQEGGSRWNNFVVDNWAFLLFAEEVVKGLVGEDTQSWNIAAGEEVEFRLPPAHGMTDYLLRRPGFRQTRENVLPGAEYLAIDNASAAGHYRTASAGGAPVVPVGFSANLPTAETDLTRLTEDDLDSLFGQENYQLTTTPDELEAVTVAGRLGIEVFPVLIGLAVLAFVGEQLMSVYFYDEEPSGGAESGTNGGGTAS